MLKKYFISSLRNTHGFSLTEALIGVGMIAGLAVIVAQFGVQNKPMKQVTEARTCDSVSQAVLEAIKSRSAYNDIHNWNTISGSRFYPPASPPYSAPPFVNAADFWAGIGSGQFDVNTPLAGSYATPGDQVADREVVRSGYGLIDGYMRTISTIYNSNPGSGGFCGNWRSYPNITAATLNLDTNLLADTNADGRGDAPPIIELQILPYNTKTGVAFPCGSAPANADILPFPPPSNISSAFDIPDGAFSDTNPNGTGDNQGTTFTAVQRNFGMENRKVVLHNYPPGGRADVGFDVRVRVRYTNFDGDANDNDRSCEASQRFQFRPDTSAPDQPVVTIVANNSSPNVDGNYRYPSRSSRTVRIEVSYPGAEKGVQLYCRDRSKKLVYLAQSAGGRGLYCFAGGAYTSTYPNYGSTPEAMVGVPEDTGRVALPGNTVTQDWVPCDSVRICGIDPSPATRITGSTTAPNIRLNYVNNLAEAVWGCDIALDVIAVDTAGNRSDVANLVRTAFAFSNNNASSVVRRPRCLAITTPNPSLHYGVLDAEWGWLCKSSGHYTTNYNAHPASNLGVGYDTTPHWRGWRSTKTPGPNNDSYETEFPNGYYTTSASGCCYNPPMVVSGNAGAHVGQNGNCTPR